MNSQFGIDVPRNVYSCLRAGISMFRMVYPKRLNFDETIMGFYNVSVSDEDADIGAVNIAAKNVIVDWRTGSEASITYERIDNQGTGIAWMPDDMFWHNRVMLMDNPAPLSTVKELMLPNNNIKNGAEVMMELRCLERALKKEVVEFQVFINNIYSEHFYDKKEAEEYVESKKSMEIVTDKDAGLKVASRQKRAIEIRERRVMVYKDEIVRLIETDRFRHKFGWTESDMFMKDIKPLILANIKDEHAKLIAHSDNAFVITPEELAKLRETAKKMEMLEGVDMDKLVSLAARTPTPPVSVKTFTVGKENKPHAVVGTPTPQ